MKELLRNLTLRFPELYDYTLSFGVKFGELHKEISTIQCFVVEDDAIIVKDGLVYPDIAASKAMLKPLAWNYRTYKYISHAHTITSPFFYAGGLCSDNYWHMLIEILPLYLKYGNGMDILVSSKFKFYDMFEAFEISRSKILKHDFIKYYSKLLIVPSKILSIKEKVKILQDNYLLKVFPINYPKKLYISREDSKRRRVINEQELTSMLVKKYKFFCNVMSIPCFYEQVSFFNAVETLILPHGAASANLFAAKNCKIVIELLPSIGGGYTTQRICQAMGIEYIPIECRNHWSNMIAPIDEIEQYL